MNAWRLRPSLGSHITAQAAEFVESLKDAYSWCGPRFSMRDLERCLRTPALRPHQVDEDGVLGEASVDTVGRLVMRRRELLKDPPSPPTGHCSWLKFGMTANTRIHLLCTYPSESSWDGASEPPTGGFLNDADEAPWDAWVLVWGEALIALIPEELVSAVQVAIDVSALECLDWLGNRDDEPARGVREILEAVPYP
jgi:hypothetical protein